MTTHRNCPNCGHRLPRPNQFEFTHPADGAELLFGSITVTALIVALCFAMLRSTVGGLPVGQQLQAETGLVYIMITELGIATSLFQFYRDTRPKPEPEPEPEPERQTLGDGFREVDRGGNRARLLRERGFEIPAEPERGALSKWLWAVVDKNVTFSQRGARAAIRDNDEVRDWAKDILALWCKAGWAEPSMGWNGPEPVLSNGVKDEDMTMIYYVASHGVEGMIEKLLEAIDDDVEARSADVEPPYFGGESADPATG